MRQTEKKHSLPPPPFKVSDDTAADWYSVHVPFRTVPTDKTPSAQPCLQPSGGDAVKVLFTPTLTFHWVLLCCPSYGYCVTSLYQPLAQRLIWRYFSDAMLLHAYFHEDASHVRLSICKGSEQDWLRKWCCGPFSLKSLRSRGGKHHTSFLEGTQKGCADRR